MRWKANVDAIRADELLRSGRRLSPEQLREAVLLATGNERLAAREEAEARLEEIRSKSRSA